MTVGVTTSKVYKTFLYVYNHSEIIFGSLKGGTHTPVVIFALFIIRVEGSHIIHIRLVMDTAPEVVLALELNPMAGMPNSRIGQGGDLSVSRTPALKTTR